MLANMINIITAMKGLVEDGLLPDAYSYLSSPYSDVDFAADEDLNGLVVAATLVDAEAGSIRLQLVRRQSRVIYSEASVSNIGPKAVALIVVAMLADAKEK